ncbi:MAG TPA: hypothetical protein VMK12_24510 [Anaeromyxobacteraceae bacterium]|nr:hypothetical protein [Anaeromyxobacteraceae bacterium]
MPIRSTQALPVAKPDPAPEGIGVGFREAWGDRAFAIWLQLPSDKILHATPRPAN